MFNISEEKFSGNNMTSLTGGLYEDAQSFLWITERPYYHKIPDVHVRVRNNRIFKKKMYQDSTNTRRFRKLITFIPVGKIAPEEVVDSSSSFVKEKPLIVGGNRVH